MKLTRTQTILKLLIEQRKDNTPFLLRDHIDRGRRVWIAGGYLPMYALRGVDRGGDAADVRLRELRREHLVPISSPHMHLWTDIDGTHKSVPLYRLDMTQQEAKQYDWDPAFKIPFTWKFDTAWQSEQEDVSDAGLLYKTMHVDEFTSDSLLQWLDVEIEPIDIGAGVSVTKPQYQTSINHCVLLDIDCLFCGDAFDDTFHCGLQTGLFDQNDILNMKKCPKKVKNNK